MHIPAWLPLARLSLYPQNQVGEWGSNLAKLSQFQVPLAPTFVIPVQTFHDLAHHNHLAEELEKLQQKYGKDQTLYRQRVAKLFFNLRWPKDTASELLAAFHQIIGPDLAEIKFSAINPIPALRHLHLPCVAGDTNTFDSVLQLWAEAYLLTDMLFPGAVVIRRQTSPQSSGTAMTKDSETETKTQIVVFSAWGANPSLPTATQYDQFKVDVRTWNILFSQIAHKTHQFLCQPDQLEEEAVPDRLQHASSLSEAQVTQLAKTVQQIKLQFFHHCQVWWELHHQQFVITGLQPLEERYQEQGLPHPHAALISASSVVSGVIEGVCYLGFPSPNQPLPSSAILVVPEFTSQLKPLLGSLAGLIVEKPLPPYAHQLVHHFHLPTVSLAHHARHHLHQGQSIILDATSGHVFAKQLPVKGFTVGQTIAKVWTTLSGEDSHSSVTTPMADGVLFKADRTFAEFGEHPLHLVKSERRTQLINHLIQAMEHAKPKHHYPLVYQPVDITSAELIKFHFSGSYEATEPNPYLGYRGSLRLSHSFAVFDTELEAIAELAQRNHSRLGLAIPLTRTPTELRAVIAHLRHQTIIPSSRLELWWNISTPENVWQLEQYLSPQLTGVIVSFKDLHALLHGIDPSNPDVYARYPVNIQLMTELLLKVVKHCHHQAILLHIDNHHLVMAEMVVKLKLAGVIVETDQITSTRHHILESEAAQLQG